MSNQKRIEEVARLIDQCYRGLPEFPGQTVKLLSSLPEFQSWVPCSERMPPQGMEVLAKTALGTTALARFYPDGKGAWHNSWAGSDYDRDEFRVWLAIPPYVAPESELVRRFRKKAEETTDWTIAGLDSACTMLSRIETEMADGKHELVRKYMTYIDANKHEDGMIEADKAIQMLRMTEKEMKADGK